MKKEIDQVRSKKLTRRLSMKIMQDVEPNFKLFNYY